ncbi:MAG: PilZ domain-containing protein [Candidatus Helarchaeota archaeon]|nr:PilZ domain-containing protein [Candidatus Helarchaeota archaeon]
METGKPVNLERRNFPRIEDTIFIFGNLSSASNNLRTNTTGGFKAFTKNIGGGGLMFEIEKDVVKAGNELELEIYQPVNPDKTVIYSIPVLAKVIWTNKIEKEHFEIGENKYTVGIGFTVIREQDRQKIIKYMDKLPGEGNRR